MNKIIAQLKRIRLGQVLMAFLASLLLIVSTTACSGQAIGSTEGTFNQRGNKATGGTADQVRQEVPGSAVTNKFKGGMNDYSDVDPRTDTTKASAKAKGLIDNAERNVIDQTDDVGTNTKRILDKKGENAVDFGKNAREDAAGIVDKTKGTAAELKDATQKGTENIKANTSNAAQNAKSGAKDAASGTAAKAKGAAEDTKDAADIAGKQFKALGNKLKQNAAETGDSIKSESGKALNRAVDAVD